MTSYVLASTSPKFLVHCHSLQVFHPAVPEGELGKLPTAWFCNKPGWCYLYHIVDLMPDDNQSSSQQFIANLFNVTWKILESVHHRSDRNSTATWTTFDKHRINSHSNRKRAEKWDRFVLCAVTARRVHREWSEEIFRANTFLEGWISEGIPKKNILLRLTIAQFSIWKRCQNRKKNDEKWMCGGLGSRTKNIYCNHLIQWNVFNRRSSMNWFHLSRIKFYCKESSRKSRCRCAALSFRLGWGITMNLCHRCRP